MHPPPAHVSIIVTHFSLWVQFKSRDNKILIFVGVQIFVYHIIWFKFWGTSLKKSFGVFSSKKEVVEYYSHSFDQA